MSARRLPCRGDAPPTAAALAHRHGPGAERVVPIAQGRDFGELHARLVARGYIEFRQLLADAFGGYKAALMLGHALYWTRHWIRQQPGRVGWFWKTASEWTEATGLTPREQERARAALRDSGVWQEQLAGAPAKMHYRVDVEALCTKLGSQDITGLDEPARDQRLTSLLGAPIMFFRSLVDIAGGVSAGLLLSYLLERYRTAVLHRAVDANGFFHVSLEGARIALNLGVKAQRNARETLTRAGLLRDAVTQEQRPRLMVRLNLEAILACVCGQAEPKRRMSKHKPAAYLAIAPAPVEQSVLRDRTEAVVSQSSVGRVVRLLEAGGKSARPDAPKPLRRLLDVASVGVATLSAVETDDGGNRQSRVALLSKQQTLSGAEGCPFVETRHALLSNLYKQKEVSKTTTTVHVGTGTSCDGPGGRGRTMALPFDNRADATAGHGDLSDRSPQTFDPLAAVRHLVLPEQLDPALHDNALRIVLGASESDRQPLLDELAGHLAMPGKTVANPLGWLRSLSARAAQGDVILTLAPAVAAARARKHQHNQALQRAAANAAPGTTSQTAAVRDQIARVRKTRDQLALRSGHRVAQRGPTGEGGNATCASACGARSDADCATETGEAGDAIRATGRGGVS